MQNKLLSICEQFEKDGKAVIIRPIEPLKIDRTGKNIADLLDLYDEGHEKGKAAVKLLDNKPQTTNSP